MVFIHCKTVVFDLKRHQFLSVSKTTVFIFCLWANFYQNYFQQRFFFFAHWQCINVLGFFLVVTSKLKRLKMVYINCRDSDENLSVGAIYCVDQKELPVRYIVYMSLASSSLINPTTSSWTSGWIHRWFENVSKLSSSMPLLSSSAYPQRVASDFYVYSRIQDLEQAVGF